MATRQHTVPDLWLSVVAGGHVLLRKHKKKKKGVTIYVTKWSDPGHITVKDRVRCPDIELLTMSPSYFPRSLFCLHSSRGGRVAG